MDELLPISIEKVGDGWFFRIGDGNSVGTELIYVEYEGEDEVRKDYKTVDSKTKLGNNTISNKQEESKMRRVVKIEVFDDDKGLPVELSLVGVFNEVVTEDDNDSAIREVLMSGGEYEPDELSMSELLQAHNSLREQTINEDILNRTGNEVMLRGIKLKDLRFKVIG